MTNACHKKCIPPKYHESDLTKGESVCIDRCVAKYFEIHDKVGKKLTALSTQQAQAQMAANTQQPSS
jgi:import inner membrane translocase subunit TIM10